MGQVVYDCTKDVREHQESVKRLMLEIVDDLMIRLYIHDESKLLEPEKSCYDKWKPKLETLKFGTPEYDDAIKQMGDGLTHHFQNNPHHPEYHRRGISDMTLVDIIEMLCDWMAVNEHKHTSINWEYLGNKFSIGSQLLGALTNQSEALKQKEW